MNIRLSDTSFTTRLVDANETKALITATVTGEMYGATDKVARQIHTVIRGISANWFQKMHNKKLRCDRFELDIDISTVAVAAPEARRVVPMLALSLKQVVSGIDQANSEAAVLTLEEAVKEFYASPNAIPDIAVRLIRS